MALSNSYDIVAIDLVMPDIHGIEVFREIQGKDRNIPMAIFTGEDTINQADLQELSPKPLILHKPFDISDIEAACFDEFHSPLQVVPTITARNAEASESRRADQYERTSDGHVIKKLDELSQRIPHTLLGIFKWLESDLRLKFLKGVGIKPGSSVEEMERQVFYSPLRNMAEDREIINIPNMTESSFALRRLMKNIFPFTDYFESFFGAPLVVHGHSRYVVFFGHALPDVFDEQIRSIIEDRFTVIGAELTVREAYQQIEAQQRLALRGELTASLAHEIRNRLHIISMNMKAMKKLGPRASHKLQQAKVNVPKELSELNQIIEESQSAIDKISDVVTALSDDIGERGYSEFDLSSVIRAVVSRMNLIASRKNVAIQIDIPDTCPAAGSPARLGQVVENLILNAIQHTHKIRKRHGQVTVRGGIEKDDGSFYVEVDDNGEGVHAKDYERIFEMGFTTKESGSGVGLALCAAAMRSLSGRVFVKNSIVFEGTTMRVEWKVSGVEYERK